MTNYLKTFTLMALLTALFVGVAGALGGTGWMAGAFVFAAVFNFGSYWFSDRAVLRMYRARIVGRDDAPELYDMVDRLRRRAHLPMPALAIAPSEQPNAFATGRGPNHAVVCVTRGLLPVVTDSQLEGILSHELAHVRNRDLLVGTVAATMSAAIVMLARVGFFFGGDRDRGPAGAVGAILSLILAPVAAVVIQMAISRAAEFRADRVGAEISGRPRDLAAALRALEARSRRIPMRVNPAAAHLCIVNPLRGGGTGRTAGVAFASLFRTHPRTDERVRRLEAMA
ncbi:MAG: M48 family metalloprotease [Gemmatimonadota bacterium]